MLHTQRMQENSKKPNPFTLVVHNDDGSFSRTTARGVFHAIAGGRKDAPAAENQAVTDRAAYPNKYANIMSPQPHHTYPQRNGR